LHAQNKAEVWFQEVYIMNRLLALGSLFLVIGVLLFAPPARADSTDTFTFQVTNQGGKPFFGVTSLSWVADSSPTPVSFCGICFQFTITADLTVNGTDIGPTSIAIGNGDGTGGFVVPSLGLNVFSSQLYVGPPNDPTFVPGTYLMYDTDLPAPVLGVLTVVATPEPGVLSLLCAGLLGALFIALYSNRLWIR
jgi:hypothetical protein